MTLIALVLVLLVAVVGAALALMSAVVRGDGLVGPGRSHQPPRSHPADVFEASIRRLV